LSISGGFASTRVAIIAFAAKTAETTNPLKLLWSLRIWACC